jgi:hypothetical protein
MRIGSRKSVARDAGEGAGRLWFEKIGAGVAMPWVAMSMPVATTDTRTMPSRLSSKVAPKMMLACSSTSLRMRVAASSTS